MSNAVFNYLLKYITKDKIKDILAYDEVGSKKDIIAFLTFSETSSYLTSPIIGNTIITDGNIYTTLKIINDVILLHGEFTINISNTNKVLNTYLVKRANDIYQKLNMDIRLFIDYSLSANKYQDKYVTIIGSKAFVIEKKEQLPFANYIIIP